MNTLVKAALISLLGLPVAPAQDPKAAATREAAVADGETVTLRVALSEASRNLVTSVTLPDTVKNVVSAWDPKDLSVEHDGAKLFVKLLSKSEGYLDVTTLSGGHYRLLVQPAAGTFDTHVVVRAAEREKPNRVAGASGAVELIRSMRLGEAPKDAIVAKAQGELLAETDSMKITLLWTYDTGSFRGLVMSVANRSQADPLQIDVTRFQAEDLVLAGSRDLQVPPGGSTRLYLVFAKR